MDYRLTALMLTFPALAGCKSVDGEFLPDCVAFAGDRISLSGGEFEWAKFTDEVSVDDDGNVVDAFPGYPRRGTFDIDGRNVRLAFADGGADETMHLHSHGSRILLLTDDQHTAWESSGRYDDCVLARTTDE